HHNIEELMYTLEALYVELCQIVIDSGSEYSCSSFDARSMTPSVEEITQSPARLMLYVTPPPSPLTVKRSNSASIETPAAVKRSMSDAESEKEVCAGGLTTETSREHVVSITGLLEKDVSVKNLQKTPSVLLTPNIKPLKPEE
ncbi:hypothetical protein L9F63_025781, partial [Diploptera punctata]